MRRFLALLAALLMVAAIGAPAIAADGTLPDTDRVLISINGDVTVAAGEHVDVVVVIQGNALIAGSAQAVTVIGGTATLDAATVEALTVIDGRAILHAGTTIQRDILQLNSTVERADGVIVGGTIRSLAQDLAGFALFMGLAAIALWIGVVLATFAAGLALAALAARQVRTAEAVISGEPVRALLAGLAMLVLPPIVFIALALTVVGLPLALSVLLIVWPVLAFIGYLVAAIWIGDWLLRASGRPEPAQRPYLASFLGLLVAGVLSLVPLVGAIISIIGLGAVTVAGWRTLAGGDGRRPSLQPQPAPMAG